MLSKLRHSVSYDDIKHIDTSWATGILEANDGYSTVPTIIRENIFIRCTLTQLNELVIMRNPMTFPKIQSEINLLQIPTEKS